MFFNTFEYVVFLAVTVVVYYLLSDIRQRMVVFLVAAYLFYSIWSVPYTALMAATTCWYYFIGAMIGASEIQRERRFWMIVGVAVSLGVLAYYKYLLFFAVSIVDALGVLGVRLDEPNWSVVLPLGLSFHTFQGVSYAVDVYRRTTPPTRDFLFFAVYSSFFPQLIAGPIERKSDVLPQLQAKHDFDWDNFNGGIALILIGLFKKVVIADNMAAFADPIFANPPNYSIRSSCSRAYAFALQIFFDFSAYSQIAVGSAQLFGIRLSQNFDAPYLALNIVDFWRRWHMTLSRWLRDYLYISLGGSRISPSRTYVNLFLTMVLGGLWHGANWTFVVWGAYHGGLLSISHYFRERNQGRVQPPVTPWMQAVRIIGTFHLVTLGWIIFRAPNMGNAVTYCLGLLGNHSIPVSPRALLAMTMIAAVAVGWTAHHFLYRHIAELIRGSSPPICGPPVSWLFCSSLPPAPITAVAGSSISSFDRDGDALLRDRCGNCRDRSPGGVGVVEVGRSTYRREVETITGVSSDRIKVSGWAGAATPVSSVFITVNGRMVAQGEPSELRRPNTFRRVFAKTRRKRIGRRSSDGSPCATIRPLTVMKTDETGAWRRPNR